MSEVSQHEKQFYRSIIPTCQVVFDVGCKADSVFEDINPSCQVHKFDPSPALIGLSNTRNVTFNNYALGRDKGEQQFYFQYGSFIKREDEKKLDGMHIHVTVMVETLDNYCLIHSIKHIDYLKIDTEGWDYDVMLGGLHTLPNVKRVQFEDWDDTMVSKIMALINGRFVVETVLNSNPKNYILINSGL